MSSIDDEQTFCVWGVDGVADDAGVLCPADGFLWPACWHSSNYSILVSHSHLLAPGQAQRRWIAADLQPTMAILQQPHHIV